MVSTLLKARSRFSCLPAVTLPSIILLFSSLILWAAFAQGYCGFKAANIDFTPLSFADITGSKSKKSTFLLKSDTNQDRKWDLTFDIILLCFPAPSGSLWYYSQDTFSELH